MDLLLPVAATFLLAGFVKGVIGLGLPTVAVGLLGLVMPPGQAAALLVVPSLATNAWQLAAGPHLPVLARRLWPMLAALLLGTLLPALLGARWMAAGADWARPALGGALLFYALLGLAAPALRLPGRAEPWAGPLAGFATGLVTAATGVFTVPGVPYLQALGLERGALVQALGLFFNAATVALAAALWWQGGLRGGALGASLLALVPALAGMALGQWVGRRVPPAMFRRGFFLALGALGAQLLLF